jgi:asparagine synthase (glutamine-hydrolysing)
MQVAIALPILHAARAAAEMGLGTAIAGHGADELFGGYHRYISEPDPRESMLGDLFDLHFRGMDLCDLASRGAGVEIFSPFLDQSVIELALSLDTKHLIGPSGRKILLRKAGKKLGLSELSIKSPKCAIQYGSGVNKHVLRVVRRS